MKSIHLDYRISGYSTIKLQGKQIQRFLNICYHRDIDIRNLILNHSEAVFDTKACNLVLLEELANRYQIQIFINKRKGLPYFLRYCLKRPGFVMGALLCYCFLIYMSNCVWEMEFCGNSYHTDRSLEKYLANIGVTYGQRTNKFNPEEIELSIRKHYTDVAWCSVQIDGCKLTVTVTESNESVIEKNNMLKPGEGISLVADRDAIISNIVTSTGEPLVVSGQRVSAGDVLVNGYITYKDDYDYIIGYKGVWARADIIAIWEIPFETSVSLRHTMDEAILTIYHEPGPVRKIFPYWYLKEIISCPFPANEVIPYEEAMIKLENKLYEQIKNWEENGYEVIEKNLKIEDNNREIYYVGTITLEGPFGVETPCMIPLISEDADEFNGD